MVKPQQRAPKAPEAAVRKKVNQSTGDRVFMGLIYTFLIIALVLVLYPLIYVVSSSFSSAHAVISGQVWLFPVEPTLDGYLRVFKNGSVLTGFKNSFILLFVGTSINVVMTILAAYPMSRRTFGAGRLIMRLFVFCMIFSGGLIPMYIVVNSLHLTDSLWGLMLPNALTVYYVIIARTFFSTTIPEELYESAYLDGCQDFRILFSIVLPLSKAVIAVLALMYGIQHWNSYFNSLIYLKSQELYPLQLVLRNILIQN